MTRVLVAFDKFKDALTARQACAAAARGLQASHPDWQLDLCPLADGGDGFCTTLVESARGRFENIPCTNPRGEQINAPIGLVDSSNLSAEVRAQLELQANSVLGIIEMASASGLARLPPDQRDPWQTSSRGTGEQLLAAAKAGASVLLLGVGGSATHDLGLGALAALGLQFSDEQGARIASPVPSTWEKIAGITGRAKLPPLFIACDVSNPLLGPTGAAATFGPQKGLRAADFPKLERQTARLAALLCQSHDRSSTLCDGAGTGAAGGFAFGLMVAANAKLISGFDLVSAWLELPARVAAADLVLTGEGCFDATSLAGKGPGSLVTTAQRLGKPVHVFAGRIDLPVLTDINVHGITPASLSLKEALPRTAELLASAVAAII